MFRSAAFFFDELFSCTCCSSYSLDWVSESILLATPGVGASVFSVLAF